MKRYIILLMSLIPKFAYADVPVRITDGNVEFAVANINGRDVWSTKERDEMILSVTFATAPAPVIVNYVTTKFEIELSTSFKYVNYSSYLEAKTLTKNDIESLKKDIEKQTSLKKFRY